MNIKNLLTCIIFCTILSHTYTMELVLSKQEQPEKTVFVIDYDCPFLKLPPECLDKIIFFNQPLTIGALKNSCKYLCSRASIMRIEEPSTQYFRIYDDVIRAALFQTIVKTDNSEYIEKILLYGKKEALLQYNAPEDATAVVFDESNKSYVENSYINKNYLPLLLENAIRQNKYNPVKTLTEKGATSVHGYDGTPLNYAAQCNSDRAIQALLDSSKKPIDTGQINYSVQLAWKKNNQNALKALSINESTEKYIISLKDDNRSNKRYCIFAVTSTLLIPVLIAGAIFIPGGIITALQNNTAYNHSYT